MGTQSTASTVDAPTGLSDLAGRGGVAVVLAVLGNVAFVSVANLLGVAPGFEAYAPFIAARGTAVGSIGAVLVYGVLMRLRENPNRLFTIISAIVYVIGLVPVVFRAPNMPGATTAGVALLPVMHAIAAVACVVFLTGRVSWP